MSARERGQEMETLPGARKSGHKTRTAVDVGEQVGAGSRHIVPPSGDSTRLCACSRGHTCLDTLSARSCNYGDFLNSLVWCVHSLY